jgi:hypothetical protein
VSRRCLLLGADSVRPAIGQRRHIRSSPHHDHAAALLAGNWQSSQYVYRSFDPAEVLDTEPSSRWMQRQRHMLGHVSSMRVCLLTCTAGNAGSKAAFRRVVLMSCMSDATFHTVDVPTSAAG